MSDTGIRDAGGRMKAMKNLSAYGLRHEPRLMVASVALAAIASVPQTLMIYWIGFFVDGLTDRNGLVIGAAAGALGCSLCVGWILTTISDRVAKRFRDRMAVVFETRIAELQSGIPTLEHQERSDILDRLAVLRNESYVLDHMYGTVLQTMTWLTRIISVLILLASVHPASLVLLVALIPATAVSLIRPVRERLAEEQAAPNKRLADHLHEVLTSAESSKEVRVFGLGPELKSRRRREWTRWHDTIARGRNTTAMSTTLAWSVFFAAIVGVIVLVTANGVSTGDAAILLLGAQQLGGFVAVFLTEVGYIRGTWMEGSERMAWLEAYADSTRRHAGEAAPDHRKGGIRARGLTFTYPGSAKPALVDVDLDVPPGSVVAIVGENGAGKSTLVKLLAGFYTGYTGRLEIGGANVGEVEIEKWRSRLAGCFQDFSRFEVPVRESIGVGDLDAVEDDAKVLDAARRGGAETLVGRLPQGLETQLGRQWPGGIGLSGGEWQKVALSRCFMRGAPMIRFLDEPTSALDAETEYELFTRYAESAKDADLITVLVSHRFSTVSMADHIIVMDGARVVEQGSHDELMSREGLYADLFRTQSEAYTRVDQ